MNLKMDELKEQWRVEKAALELASAQKDIKDVSPPPTHYFRVHSLIQQQLRRTYSITPSAHLKAEWSSI